MAKFLGFLLLIFLMASADLLGQANDDFSKAAKINISANGKKLGTFKGQEANLTNATKERGEFVEALQVNLGLDQKTVWYWFELPTSRSVSINLKQKDTLIAQNGAGISIYKNPTAKPNSGDLKGDFPSITKFGTSRNSCAKPGIYYIQVVSNAKTNAPIWIELELTHSSNAPYDFKSTAYDFGIIENTKDISISMGCYSIGKEDGICAPTNLRQSLWVTFKTGSHADYFNVRLRLSKGSNPQGRRVSLYKGNCRTDSSSLTAVEFCRKNGFKRSCGLEPFTDYSVQVIVDKNYDKSVSLNITSRGVGDSKGADPKKLSSPFTLMKYRRILKL